MDSQPNGPNAMRGNSTVATASRSTDRVSQRGFSLVEIAIVLVIVGLALGTLLSMLGPQLQQRRYIDTLKQLTEANEAIVAFALVNRRLPCPATATSAGRESFCTAVAVCGAEVIPPTGVAGFTNGRCFAAANAGFVPSVTLGLGGQTVNGLSADSWAAPLRYTVPNTTNVTNNNAAVTPTLGCAGGANTCYPYTQVNGIRNAYYNNGAIGPAPLISSDVWVCATATGISGVDCNAAAQRANPAFIVYSTGLNRAALGTDETANTNIDRVFVYHERTEDGAPAPNGGFDDLLVWTTFDQLIARMSSTSNTP